jgi:hypothetical protein
MAGWEMWPGNVDGMFHPVLILVCGVGGGAAFATLLVGSALAHRYEHLETAVVAIDVGLLLGPSILTARSIKWWPIAAKVQFGSATSVNQRRLIER